MAIYLNTFRPLCLKKRGRDAIRQYDQPPFVDHSVRREPSLEHKFPGISALCRAGKFAPKLQLGDIVIYMTVKSEYTKGQEKHWKLPAILEVIQKCETHQEAAEWYRSEGCEVPNNCVVTGSNALPYHLSMLEPGAARMAEGGYRKRSRKHPQFLICKPLFLELSTPPKISDKVLHDIFRRVPGTQNPPVIMSEEYNKLLNLAGITINF